MLALNDTVYYLAIKNNAWHNNKISYVDEAGVEWFRYSLPSYSYNIIEYRIVGRTTSQSEWVGEALELTPENTYYVESGQEVYDSDFNATYARWFLTRAEAEEAIAIHKELKK